MHLVISLRGFGRKVLAVVAILAVIVGIHLLTDGAVRVVSTLIASRLVPIYKVDRPDKVLSISFDAMWGTEYTDEILDILDRYQVKTTFFLGGNWVQQFPDYVVKIRERGHEIGNHSYSHPHMASLSRSQMRKEIELNHENIKRLINEDPILFRPPFGEYNNALVETCFELGYYPIQWSIDSLDWKDVSADYIVNRVMANAGPGEIVLLHNNGTNTAKAVAQFIPMLQKQGYRIVPISELIYKEDYYIEGHSGIQKSTKPPDQLRQQEGGSAS